MRFNAEKFAVVVASLEGMVGVREVLVEDKGCTVKMDSRVQVNAEALGAHQVYRVTIERTHLTSLSPGEARLVATSLEDAAYVADLLIGAGDR